MFHRSTMVVGVGAALLALAGCGGDSKPSQPVASTPVPVTHVTGTPKPARHHRRRHHQATPTPTATATARGTATAATNSPDIPDITPTPGPALPFGANITATAISPNLTQIPAGKNLSITLHNDTGLHLSVTLKSNGSVVGAASIEKHDQIGVQVRFLAPGTLTITSGVPQPVAPNAASPIPKLKHELKATVKVVHG